MIENESDASIEKKTIVQLFSKSVMNSMMKNYRRKFIAAQVKSLANSNRLAETKTAFLNNQEVIKRLVTYKTTKEIISGKLDKEPFFDANRKHSTKNGVKKLAQEAIPRFTSLNESLFKMKKDFVSEINTFVRENLGAYLKESQNKGRENIRKLFLAEMKKKANELDLLIRDFMKKERDIHEYELRIISEYKIKTLRQKEFKQEIEAIRNLGRRYKEQKKSAPYLFSKYFNRSRSNLNLDVTELVTVEKPKGANIVNPLLLMKARIKNLKDLSVSIVIKIRKLEERLKKMQQKRDQCKCLIKSIIGFLLKNPEKTVEFGLSLKKVILMKMKVGEAVEVKDLGGEFTLPEKQFIIEMAKLEKRWNEEKAKIRKEKLKMKKNRSMDLLYSPGRGGDQQNKSWNIYSSNLIYPSRKDTKVSQNDKEDLEECYF